VAEGVVDLVQRDQHGHAALAVDLGQQVHHAAAGFGIERCDGLVGQQDPGALHQGARDRRALLLPAGECGGALPGATLDAHVGQRVERTLQLLAREAAQQAAPHRQPVQRTGQHVGHHRQSVDQVELLSRRHVTSR
jgi:hypothetical protein